MSRQFVHDKPPFNFFFKNIFKIFEMKIRKFKEQGQNSKNPGIE